MKKQNPETAAVRIQTERGIEREHATPIFMTSSFVFDSAEQAERLFANEEEGNIYSRYSNPSTDEFIRKLATLEGLEAGIATASGMAAVFSSMAAFLESGDHILVARALFGSTHQILTQIFPKWGIQHTYVDGTKPETWSAALTPKTKMFFLETPSNPGLEIIDLQQAGDFAKTHQLLFLVDNCFATPYLQQPALYGADLVIHSATKFIDGQGRGLGGAILGSQALISQIEAFTRHTGPALSPFNSWMFSKSLETLAVRMERHCATAFALAEQLESHPAIQHVRYPFLPSHPQHELAISQMKLGGGLFTMTLSDKETARKWMNALCMISRSSNLGDSRTIATHPATTTHSKLTAEERLSLGITDGLLRISCGLEHQEDILTDIVQALEVATSSTSEI